MLPVGKYLAKAMQAELGFADTGTEVVAVQFEVTEGENKGARLTWRGYFTEKTARRAIESLKYCGWGGDWDTWEGLGSQIVQLDVQEDRDIKSGEVRGTRVAWVNPARVPMKNSMDPSQRTTFAARMKGIVTEVMGAGGVVTSRGALPFRAAKAPVPARQAGAARTWSGNGGGGARSEGNVAYAQPQDDPGFESDDIPF